MAALTIALQGVQLPCQGVIRPRHANKLITKQGLHTQFRRRIRANHPGFQVYRPAAQSLAVAVDFLHKTQAHRWRLRRDMRQQGWAKVIHKTIADPQGERARQSGHIQGHRRLQQLLRRQQHRPHLLAQQHGARRGRQAPPGAHQ